jgi:hypothetical protein
MKRGAEGDVEIRRGRSPTRASDAALSRIASPNELDAWIEGSPLVELTEVQREIGEPRRLGAPRLTAPAALKIAGVTDRKVSRALVGWTLAESAAGAKSSATRLSLPP